jgi:CheY-like chemotaxis protein
VTGSPAWSVALTFPIKEWIKVLVIDDNADARLLFQRYLEGSRYHVIGAADGRQGVKLAQDLQPDVILLDIMMPEHDGWEILGQLRVHPQTQSIPVFVCTILAQEELALALGAAQFIRKPVNPAALLLALERRLDPPRQGSG